MFNMAQSVQAALEDEKCVVIGLQSTGDARTVEAVAERAVDGELDDFVSGPKVSHPFALMVLSELPSKLVSISAAISTRPA